MIAIRAEGLEDIAAIRQVHERAFGRPNEATLVELLRKANKAAIALVALGDGQVVGHIVFSPITVAVAPKRFRAVGLGPVSVRPEFQKTGIGSQLIRHGLKLCKQAGYDAVVVLGDPNYYSRFGFSRASDYHLDNEYNAREEFMAMELTEGAMKDVKGMAKYQPKFSQSDC
jgi:putative acetyltransferase